MPTLKIDYLSISALTPRPTNPRTHSKRQIEQIAASIKRFGFTNPILIDNERGIIAGHGRLAAAQQLGMTEVPTVRLAGMSEAEIRAYVIADNKLAENAGWDCELLALEFQYLSELEIDLDVTVTGFELPEIDVMISKLSDGEGDLLDETPELSDGPTVSRLGDVWTIDRHRLICGDALKRDTYSALLEEERVQMVFCDPPYNVPIDGNVCGLGETRHREFAMASGEMSQSEFTAFLTRVFENLAAYSIDGSIHFQCMDWRHMGEMLAAGAAAYEELKNLCVWSKTNGGMGSLYRSQHELVFVFRSGAGPHINNVELGRHGRYRTNVWCYPGLNGFGEGRADLTLHPTVKPVALVADAILDCSHRKGLVLDAFAGSGTTLVAAAQTGRRGFGIEIDPRYVDVILRRMKTVCGLEATLAETGRGFEETADLRASEASGTEEAA